MQSFTYYMNITLRKTSIPHLPNWSEELYLDRHGNYNMAVFKYDSIKADHYVKLSPGGDF